MADEQLILWGEKNFYSPYVFSCFVALTEKGLPFEVRTFDLFAGEHRKGDYGARSITGRVPSLQHGDLWLAESSAIDEYLEEVFPPPRHARLYPERPADRARARQLQAWVRSDLAPVREERPTSSVFMRDAVKPLTPAGREAADRLVRAAEALLPQGAAWLFGDFGIADADLAMMLQRLVANGDPVPARLGDYARRVWERPSVKAWRARSPRPR
jgi:glutathione S-transferase